MQVLGWTIAAFIFFQTWDLRAAVESASVPTVVGELFELESKPRKKLYDFSRWDSFEGEVLHVRSSFKDTDGKLIVEEDLKTRGKHFESYTMIQHQFDEKYEVRREGNEIVYVSIKKGVKETDRETWSPDLVIGATTLMPLLENWSAMLNGEEIFVRIIVPDRADEFGFKFFKDKTFTENGRNLVDVKFKPRSMIIAAFVDPIHFIFDAETKELLRAKGTTLLTRMVDGKQVPVVAESVFRMVK